MRLHAALEAFATMAPGVNPNSNPQMVKFLYETMGEPIRQRTDGGNPSTNEAALLSLNNHNVRDVLLEARHWKKVPMTSTTSLRITNRVGYLHADLKSDGARTVTIFFPGSAATQYSKAG